MRDRDAVLLRDVEQYYSGRLREHGPTALGVDWNSAESQRLRFEQLARLWEGEAGMINLIDYGCGYGALLDFLDGRGTPVKYQGYDVSPAMVEAASRRAAPDRTFTSQHATLARADWVVASGIFNVRLKQDDGAWTAYMRRAVADLASLGRRGFAFNALTSYADQDKQRQDLYYADPGYWFDLCKRAHSPKVTLLHDYALYEFTILVRL